MKGKIKFDRKDPVMEVDDFEVIAVEILPHSVFTGFQRNMLNDYDFIVPFADDMHVDSDDVAHAMLVLDEEGEDGILINSEGSYYGRYTSYLPKAKKLIRDEIQEVAQAIIKGRFGDNGNGSWVIGFDDIKEHFDLTVTPNNGIGTLLLEELENQEEVGEIIATEDCFEITQYLDQVPEDADVGEKFMTVLSLMGCNLEDVHLVDKDEEHELATIVELNAKMLTEEGKREWADVLNAKVERIYEGSYGLQIEVSGCPTNRLCDFSFALAGYVSPECFNKWFKKPEEIEKEAPQKEYKPMDKHEVKMALAKHTLWLYSTDGNDGVQADFSNCILDNICLRGAELNNAIFEGAKLVNCDLSSSELCFANFNNAILIDCDLSHSTADEVMFKDAIFERCSFQCYTGYHGNYKNSTFKNCDMFNANLHNSCYEGSTFPETNLSQSDVDPENPVTENEWSNHDEGMVM